MNPDQLFLIMDQVDELAAFLAGVKQKFINHGFSPQAAEELVCTLWAQQAEQASRNA